MSAEHHDFKPAGREEINSFHPVRLDPDLLSSQSCHATVGGEWKRSVAGAFTMLPN